MKKNLTIAILIFSMTAFGQKYSDVMTEKMTSEQWKKEATTNIRLLPKYGHASKTDEQKAIDKEFIETTLKQYSTKRKASDHLVELGFHYLYKDIKTAMYRFNQAYLLDSTNTDIYWGYGGVYMILGDLENVQKQYVEGLTINPKNTHILTDYGTYYMSQYYFLQPLDEKNASFNLDSATNYLIKSFQLDKKDPNTSFKLSVCYYQKKDCVNSWKYYNICKSVGGQPITDDFTKALTEQCKNK